MYGTRVYMKPESPHVRSSLRMIKLGNLRLTTDGKEVHVEVIPENVGYFIRVPIEEFMSYLRMIGFIVSFGEEIER